MPLHVSHTAIWMSPWMTVVFVFAALFWKDHPPTATNGRVRLNYSAVQGYSGKAYKHSCLILTLILLGLQVPWWWKCCQASGEGMCVCVFWKAKMQVCVAFRPLLASSRPTGIAACSEVNHYSEPPTPSLTLPSLPGVDQHLSAGQREDQRLSWASFLSPISLRYRGLRAAAMW